MRSSPLARTATSIIVLLLVIHFTIIDAVNLNACGASLLAQQNTLQNTTNTTVSPFALQISYEQCLVECGSGMGGIDWQNFSQNFGSGLLPWIALMFQIPFGAERPLDDVVSFLITMGSPAVAAYSLQITHLNKCWITSAFSGVRYSNSKLVSIALAAFHHIPIKIEYEPPFLHSLIALAKNDEYWCQLAAANKTRRWSIPLVMSFVLAIFSLILTVADSITTRGGDSGYDIAAIWTFLLPLVIGWLHIGYEPEPSHLRTSLAAANRNAWVATERRDHPTEMSSPMAIEFAEEDDVHPARSDELKPVPLFNYSRAFVTPMVADVVLRLMRNAAVNAKQRIPVGNSVGVGAPVWVRGKEDDIHPANRVGTTDEVVGYCTMVFQRRKWNSGSITPLEIQSPEMSVNTSTLLEYGLVTPSRWAPGIWQRVVVASIFALGLQWGTTGGAMFITYLTPPTGLGCHSFSFLLYGLAGTISFFLFLTSSILGQMSRPLPGEFATRSWTRTFQEAGAVTCRLLGKCVAIASAIGILLVCFFDVMGMLDNCYCSSTTFDRGRGPVAFLGSNFALDSATVGLQIGGLAGAFATAIFFGVSMYMGLPARRE
ncbi:hypothetical protein BJ322DRAFT_257646 [Thelephora terrestris]|uniref:Membrane-associated protein n=1 Tax=Thelephora terrestris TaxID=56493 RepID=A0A9P6H8A6_9AGAM|nr:hypothetical protein BJ322DRAFT_257646 [Thelephora terrestris]